MQQIAKLVAAVACFAGFAACTGFDHEEGDLSPAPEEIGDPVEDSERTEGDEAIDVAFSQDALSSEAVGVNLVCPADQNLDKPGACGSWVYQSCGPERCMACGGGRLQPRRQQWKWTDCTGIDGKTFRMIDNYFVNLGPCSTSCELP